MKKLLGTAVLATMVITPAVPALAQTGEVHVTIDGREQQFDQPPVIVNDFTFVPLRGIFESLGAQVEWDDEAKRVTITKDTAVITLNVGSKTGIVNGKPVPLDVETRIIGGRTMVPLRFLSEALGAQVSWDPDTKTVSITTAKPQVATQNEESSQTEEPSGNEPAREGLSLDEALKLAVEHDNGLKIAQKNIESADEALQDAAENIDFIPAQGGNADAVRAFAAWNKAQTNYFMAKKQYEINKETLEYSVRRAYYDVLVKQEEKRLADLALEDQEWKKRLADVKAEQGLASEYEVKQAEEGLKEARAKQEAAAKALDDAYVKLNQFLGYPAAARYELTDRPQFEKLKDVDLENHISQVVTSSSAVWLAEQNVRLADLDVKYYTFNDPSNLHNYKQTQIEADKARYSAADTKQQLEAAIRTIYHSIRQMEDQYESLQANLAKAEESLRVVQKRYDVGMATPAELFEAKLGVEQIKQQILNITVELDSLKLAFEKPWVAGTR